MRVYLPLTLVGLEQLHRSAEAGPAPLRAFAVTSALREWYVSGNEEELEFAAFSRAARASLRLLAGDVEAVPRRVVAAADVSDAEVHPGPDGAQRDTLGEVLLAHPVPLERIASVHLDAADAEPDITAAAAALDAAEEGDADARFVVDGASDHALLWYAVQEIGTLVR